MLSSLRFRLWLTYALVVGVVISIAGAAVFFYLVRHPADERREFQRLRLISSLLVQRGQVWSLLPQEFDHERLQDTLERTDNATGLRLVVFDRVGRVLADSRVDRGTAPPELPRLLARQSGALPVYRDIQGQQWLYTLTPLQDSFYLLVATPRTRYPVIATLRDEFLQPYLRGVVVALVLSLFLSIWIARWVAAPLQGITSAAEDVARGEYRQIPVKGPNEVKSLAGAFNRMVERVQASQRSQRDFVANVSHDLKTPLTSIQGFAQAILDGTAGDPQAVRGAAQVIQAEAGRMHRMVLDLLDLARLDAGIMRFDRSPLEVGDLLGNIVRKFRPQAEQRQVDLDCSARPLSATIMGDADRLDQVFTNLVDNALKHTPPGGEVDLSARQVNDWIEVVVSDTGPGVPPEELERIFERFYQTDKARRGGAGRGVGLGLAIANEIVLAHGGLISAHNRQDMAADEVPAGSGSVFVVRLPISRPDVETTDRRK